MQSIKNAVTQPTTCTALYVHVGQKRGVVELSLFKTGCFFPTLQGYLSESLISVTLTSVTVLARQYRSENSTNSIFFYFPSISLKNP